MDAHRPPAPSAAWAFFLDVDGTLLHLAATPDAVRLTPDTAAVVRALHRATGGATALVSGRAIADLDAIFGAPPLPAAGQHGFERRGSASAIQRDDLDARRLDAARQRLASVVDAHQGLLLEDKGHSLALHYRGAPAHAAVADHTMRGLARELGADYRIQRGKHVLELRPRAGDKGEAITAFLLEPPFADRIPVFVGDDLTDEDAFAVVESLGGHSVKVGEGPSRARWRLHDPDAVREWLARALAPDARDS